MSNCFYCKGKMTESKTNYLADIDGHFIIIKNVPCELCPQCGETVFSGETVERLEVIIEKLKSMMNEVEIVDYDMAA